MFSFSKTERQDLLLGTLIFTLVELSVIVYQFNIFSNVNIEFFGFLALVGISCIPLFLFHEIAHKLTAQGYGLYSEFRLNKQWAIYSLLTVLIPFKIIAPGAVITTGTLDRDINARIAIAGPLVNLLLGGVFFILIFITNSEWRLIFLFTSKFTFDIALFNLLPFSILDGSKIIIWNKYVYYLLIFISVSMWLFHPFGLFGMVLL